MFTADFYTDPEIFELEMSRIFATAWTYVGHESQMKKPGDYFTARVARKPLVIVRATDGAVRALHNQCAHRGAMVVANDAGAPMSSSAAITVGPIILTAA